VPGGGEKGVEKRGEIFALRTRSKRGRSARRPSEKGNPPKKKERQNRTLDQRERRRGRRTRSKREGGEVDQLASLTRRNACKRKGEENPDRGSSGEILHYQKKGGGLHTARWTQRRNKAFLPRQSRRKKKKGQKTL